MQTLRIVQSVPSQGLQDTLAWLVGAVKEHTGRIAAAETSVKGVATVEGIRGLVDGMLAKERASTEARNAALVERVLSLEKAVEEQAEKREALRVLQARMEELEVEAHVAKEQLRARAEEIETLRGAQAQCGARVAALEKGPAGQLGEMGADAAVRAAEVHRLNNTSG